MIERGVNDDAGGPIASAATAAAAYQCPHDHEHTEHDRDILAERPPRNYAAYASSKAALIGLTRALARDLAPAVTVNAIAPGVIETPMTEQRIAGDAWYRKVMCEATPLGRVGKPADISGVVAFLCSEDAGFIVGQTLVVDGGWLDSKYLPREA